MIDMRVGKDNRVQRVRSDWQLSILTLHLRATTLKKAAVEGDCLPVDVKQVTRPRYFPGGAGEGYFHLVLRLCVAPEDDCKTLIVLRHHHRIPASAAPFVEEVRECVFVFSRMAR